MITLEHSANLLLKLHGDTEKFKEVIPFLLEPDALRRYTGPRPYTHFERYNGDTSWIEFPHRDDLKIVDKENILTGICNNHFIKGGYPKCVIGEETQIDVYEEHNQIMKEEDPENYIGILNHLIQDVDFDIFVRKVFDCSRRYEDIFKFNGKEIDGQEMRRLVQILSEFGLYRLAYLIFKETGIIINQDWYEENVHQALRKLYSEDLADGTYQYMKIPENINTWITNRDWSHFGEGIIPVEEYDIMYSNVLKKMKEFK